MLTPAYRPSSASGKACTPPSRVVSRATRRPSAIIAEMAATASVAVLVVEDDETGHRGPEDQQRHVALGARREGLSLQPATAPDDDAGTAPQVGQSGVEDAPPTLSK